MGARGRAARRGDTRPTPRTIPGLRKSPSVRARSLEIYEKTVWTALAAHRDDLAVESAAALVGIAGYYLARPDDSARWAVIAQALLERLGPGHNRAAAWFYQDRAVAAAAKVRTHADRKARSRRAGARDGIQ
jgi:hypothetical protein